MMQRGFQLTAVIMLVALMEAALAHAVEGDLKRIPPKVDLVQVVAGGLKKPLFLTHAGDGTGRLFIVEQAGTIRLIERGVLQDQPFLDISSRVRSVAYEQGLLGLAFHPNYTKNGRFFVNYNRQDDGATVLAEHRRGGSSVQASTMERILMTVPQPYANHNGGMLAFGPDGLLYVGRGDGGSAGDPQNRAQNPADLLGKILRIDVDGNRPYAIPEDNPYVKGGGRPEVFAIGLRNPWRFSFDRATGALWLADVGQNKWEEVDVVTRGGNYGWRVMEGLHCYNPELDCPTAGLSAPVLEYGHEQGRCSITGGYVYRGKAFPELQGWYIFGDFCSGEIFGTFVGDRQNASRDMHLILRSGKRISSFGEDEAGEVYVVDHSGAVYRLAPPVFLSPR